MSEPIYNEETEDITIPLEWIDFDGAYFESGLAMAQLLLDEVVYINARDTGGIILCAMCNDVFMSSAADAIEVDYKEIKDLYYAHMKDRKWGVVKWCCVKENLQPCMRMKGIMTSSGAWDDEIEKLPKNDAY